MRVLLNENIKFPGYNKLAAHRTELTLLKHMYLVIKEHPVGVALSYKLLLTHTIERLLVANEISTNETDYPLRIRVSGGIDGSGSHRIYQQARPHPDFSTKNFILFAFRVCSILNKDGNCIWKNLHPNSTFSMRPIAIVALQESDENVSFIMDSVINTETSIIEETGLDLTRGKAQVEIIRSQFDTKMAKLLRGSGGAHCQLCTATFAQAYDIDLARDGFPINRFIHDAKIFFEEVGEE